MLFVAGIAGCGANVAGHGAATGALPLEKQSAEARQDPRWEEEGRRVYRKACLGCHGERGDGGGPGARMLTPAPRNFISGVYKFRSTSSGSLPLVEDLERTIAEGVPGTTMPSWKVHLGWRERRAVAEYVLGFSDRVGQEKPERLVPPEAEVKVPDSTPAQIERGRAIYGRLQCATCHGERGRGDGPAARNLTDEDGRPQRPADFTVGIYKGGGRPFDVYRTFVTGLGATMPSFADALPSEEERWALVHYVRSLSRKKGFFEYLFGRQTNWQ